jgi:hypothetical protein
VSSASREKCLEDMAHHSHSSELELARKNYSADSNRETKVREKITEWTQGENRRGTMHPSPSTQSTWTEPETPQSVNTTGGTPFLLDIHTNNTQSPTNNMDICEEVPIVSPLRVSSRGTNHEDGFNRDDQDLDMESVTSNCSKAESTVSTMTESIDDAVGQGFKNWDDSTFNDLIDEVPTPQDADQITESPYRPHRDPVDSGIVLDDDDYDIEGSSDPHSSQAAQVPRNKSPKSRPGPIPQVPQPLLFLAQNPYPTPALNRNPFSPKSIEDLHHYVALQDLSQATEPPSQHLLEGRQLETASFSKVSPAHPVPQGFSHVAQPIPRNITQPSQPSRSALHELALNIYSESHSHESTIHRLKEALIHHDPNDNFDAYCNTPGHVALLKPLHRMQAEVTTLHWLTTWLNSLYIQNFIDEPNYDGDTILHLAARNGFHLVVQELLRRDANPFSYNKLGSCPMDECLTQTRPEDGAAAVSNSLRIFFPFMGDSRDFRYLKHPEILRTQPLLDLVITDLENLQVDFTKRYDCVKMLEAAMAALKC